MYFTAYYTNPAIHLAANQAKHKSPFQNKSKPNLSKKSSRKLETPSIQSTQIDSIEKLEQSKQRKALFPPPFHTFSRQRSSSFRTQTPRETARKVAELVPIYNGKHGEAAGASGKHVFNSRAREKSTRKSREDQGTLLLI